LRIGVAQNISPAPNGFEKILAARDFGEFLTQIADENVNDLELWLVHATISVVVEYFLGQRRALAQAQQLQHLIFFAGQVHATALNLDRFGIQVHGDAASLESRLRVTFRPADDRSNGCDEFLSVERFGQVVVSTKPKSLKLVFSIVLARQDQDRRINLGQTQLAQHFMAVHIRQVQVQQD
jgi:hypothetical protein